MEIFSVPSFFLTPDDVRKITKGFTERLGNIYAGESSHELVHCDLTLVYQGDKQAVFVREYDAHNKCCDCGVCARVRELLALPTQELTSRNIWGPTTKLLPFNEAGDRKIFLAHVAHDDTDQINTDSTTQQSTQVEDNASIHFPIGNCGDTIDILRTYP